MSWNSKVVMGASSATGAAVVMRISSERPETLPSATISSSRLAYIVVLSFGIFSRLSIVFAPIELSVRGRAGLPSDAVPMRLAFDSLHESHIRTRRYCGQICNPAIGFSPRQDGLSGANTGGGV